jgi:HTH-type transcriptional regulator / antitoxin HigA
MGTELKPIRTPADYEQALATLEDLWGSESGTLAGDQLDVLATLIDAYEAEHEPIDPPDPIEAIKFRMEQQGLTRRDLKPLIGTRTRVAEVLNRKRGLSINMIRRLHEGLGIAAEVLIQPSRQAMVPHARGVKNAATAAGGRARRRASQPRREGATGQVAAEAPGLPPAEQPARRRRVREDL